MIAVVADGESFIPSLASCHVIVESGAAGKLLPSDGGYRFTS